MELVGQGLKNREVATELGIRPGTVKVHLKHIFEKTGAQGRYNLALAGLTSAAQRTASQAAVGIRPVGRHPRREARAPDPAKYR